MEDGKRGGGWWMGPGEFSRMVGRVGGGIFALRRPRPYSRALRGYQCAMRRYKRPSAGFLIATRCGAPHRYKRTPKRRIAHKSPQTPSAPALTVRDAATGEGMYARMVNRVGGGIFAKTAKTPPLQSALRGWHCAPNIAHFSLSPPCAYHIHPACLPPMGTLRFLQRRGVPHRYPPILRSR